MIFSRDKLSIKPDEFNNLTDAKRRKELIALNRQKVLESDFAREKKGILQFEDFESFFSVDGSLISNNDPRDSVYVSFYEKQGRYSQKSYYPTPNATDKKTTYYFRGERYLTAINENLDVRQRIETLLEDFLDGLDVILSNCNGISDDKETYKLELSILDYIKNVAITFLNAFVQDEKVGYYRFDDIEYQKFRKMAFELGQFSTQTFYSYLSGDQDGFVESLEKLEDVFLNLNDVSDFLKKEYRVGFFRSQFFARPEASHPLVIGFSVLLNALETDLKPDTIFGLPSGGSEIALAQQYALASVKKYSPEIVLAPLSFHSGKINLLNNPRGREKLTLLDFLNRIESLINGKRILLVEDNSSTGSTLQSFVDTVTENFKPATIDVSVSESDIIRSKIDERNLKRKNVATDLAYSRVVNILPVSKIIKPKVDMKELLEKQRLINELRQKLAQSQDSTERIKYEIFLENIENPTAEIVDTLNDENSIRSFRGTFLSNFYATPIKYYGVDYTSTENAYQAEKFSHLDLSNFSEKMQEIMGEINDALRNRGYFSNMTNLVGFFNDPTTSSGNVKIVSEILRKYGLVRPDWEDIKVGIMLELLQIKFQDPDLAEKLKETGTKYLVEGNDWSDIFWGFSNGKGRNLLGLALMYIRDKNNAF